jgi:hypothetical protein
MSHPTPQEGRELETLPPYKLRLLADGRLRDAIEDAFRKGVEMEGFGAPT